MTDVHTLDSDEVRAVLAGDRGVTVNVEVAAAILGVGRSTLYARPLPGTIMVGARQRVPVPVLRRALGLDPDAYAVPGYGQVNR